MNIASLTALYGKSRASAVNMLAQGAEPPSVAIGHMIRVLILQPADTFDDLVECSLEECELSREARFTALSYSWATEDGDASATRVIQLNDELHPVTENLYLALLRLRSRHHPQRLWVDAVCINQDDEEDKNRQVALMGQIYGLADNVVAWLGEGHSDREDEAAFTAMQCILADKVQAPAWSPQRQQLRLLHTWLPHPLTHQIPEQCDICVAWDNAHPNCSERYGGISETLPELRRAFMTLLRRRYFRRRWIIQEINVPVADAVTFMWNRYSLSRPDFTTGQDVPSRQIPSDVFFLRKVLIGPTHNTLIHIFARAENSACSDPRDRVFALLSLAQGHGIKADYTCSVADVYTGFARLFIRENRVFDLLKICSGARATPSEPIAGLPSWVPDLRDSYSPQLNVDPTAGQPVQSDRNTLHVTLHRLGILGKPTFEDKNYVVPAYDNMTNLKILLGNVKIFRHGGLREPKEGDVLCSLEIPTPYLAGQELRAYTSGLLLRQIKENLWQITNPLSMQYVNHEYLPYETKMFTIV